MNEDDTFAALKKVPYDQIPYIDTIGWRDYQVYIPRGNWLRGTGWTEEEVIAEYTARNKGPQHD